MYDDLIAILGTQFQDYEFIVMFIVAVLFIFFVNAVISLLFSLGGKL